MHNMPMPASLPSHPPVGPSGLPHAGVPVLPPCRVCGARAHGLHYGVITCEACKTFFRRCLTTSRALVCHKSNNCTIRVGQKQLCRLCRFNKCKSLGMAKGTMKCGRYTVERLTAHMEEVKRLVQQQQNIQYPHQLLTPEASPTREDSAASSPVSVITRTADLTPPPTRETSPPDSPESPYLVRTGGIEYTDSGGYRVQVEDSDHRRNGRSHVKVGEADSSSSSLDRWEDLERAIQEMSESHRQHDPRLLNKVTEVTHREIQFCSKQRMKHEVFGIKGVLPPREYAAFYNLTGIDLDGRQEKIARLIPSMGDRFVAFQQFLMSVPGFKYLPEQDQLNITRYTVLERWVLIFNSWFNTDLCVMSFPNNPEIILTREDGSMFTENMEEWDIIIDVLIKCQKLDLTEDEATVLTALAVMNSDFDASAEGKPILSASISFLVEMLVYLVNKNHDPEELTIGRIMTILVRLREVTSLRSELPRPFVENPANFLLPKGLIECFK